jgi:hypothetical protein
MERDNEIKESPGMDRKKFLQYAATALAGAAVVMVETKGDYRKVRASLKKG